MKTIAVIGGTGHVGGAIVRELSCRKFIQIKSFGSDVIDLLNESTWHNKIETVDVVLIASGLIEGSLEQLKSINTYGISNFAKYCRQLGIKKLILISSGAVYGNTNEKTSPAHALNPITDYAKSKALGEELVKDAYTAQLNILRLYFPYGPGESASRLIPRIKKDILEGKKIFCRSDGGPFISLMHVEDMSKTIVNDFIANDFFGCEINIASDQIMGIRDLSLIIAKGVGRSVAFEETCNSNDVVSLPYNSLWRPFNFY
jgi:nucleoside-diphosphate-sugar epimerase